MKDVLSTGEPTLRGGRILGCLPELRKDRLGLLLRAQREGGDFVRLPLPGRRLYVASSPETATEVLRTKADKFHKFFALSELSRPFLGGGLLTAEGEAHRRQRKLVAPGLSRNEVARYGETMVRHAVALETSWKDGEVLDMLPTMSKLTLGIASETLFGADVAREHTGQIGHTVEQVLDYIARGVGSLVRLPYSWPLPRHRRLRRAIARFDAILEGVIAPRRGQSPGREDILGMLLAARDEEDAGSLDERQVRDEVATLLVAGFETTASALTWTFMLLSRHPEIAQRLRQEVSAVLSDGRPPSVQDLAAMPYTLQVFKEAMRLYPPGYMVGREAIDDVVIGGHHVARGATVLVNIYGLHRRADLFADPERFDPDRFASEREKALPRGAYLPFIEGPRVCIGYHFALMEGHLLLAHLMRQVALDLVDDALVPALPRVTLRPSRPVMLRVRRLR